MKGLIIDNYDSFTYNLFQYLGELQPGRIDVLRNDQSSLKTLEEDNYDYIVISPGPGHPAKRRDFGICGDLIISLGKTTPILGICLGHQGIGHCFGARVIRSSIPIHGKSSLITHDGRGVFHSLPSTIHVARYHSLTIDPQSVPKCLEVSAKTQDGAIMAIRHSKYPIVGIQFHPESILTFEGKLVLRNFLDMIK